MENCYNFFCVCGARINLHNFCAASSNCEIAKLREQPEQAKILIFTV